jgi:uncharacterized protein
MTQTLPIAKNPRTVCELLPAMANRHGCITGATGTGKTVTLQALAQQFSQIGVPVFMADVKGDLAGISQAGGGNSKVDARLKALDLPAPTWAGCPAQLWDVFGKQGHPVRATVCDMGPLLLARLLDLNEVQSGVLSIVFRVADDNGLLLLDLKDLRAMCQHVGEHASEYTTQYGNVSAASVGAIQRGLLTLEDQGGDQFFGEPMLNVEDLIQTVEVNGAQQGIVNILASDQLLLAPKLYATFLLWLLSELHETLPEAGDLDKPKLVFFFDEAHLLFNDAPKSLLERIEQTVRLIRSKGVGVYFVTQNPLDIPDTVLAQLSNRVQHALRAFTPRDQKAVQAAASTMRPNPEAGIDIAQAITELEVGEALISLLDEKGRPTPTERAFVIPPASHIGAITPEQRNDVLKNSLVAGVYETTIDRDSAYEKLTGRVNQKQPEGSVAAADAAAAPVDGGAWGRQPEAASSPAPEAAPVETSMFDTGIARVIKGAAGDLVRGTVSGAIGGQAGRAAGSMAGGVLGGLMHGSGRKDSIVEVVAKSAARSIGSSVGRQIVRGVLGGLMGGMFGKR